MNSAQQTHDQPTVPFETIQQPYEQQQQQQQQPYTPQTGAQQTGGYSDGEALSVTSFVLGLVAVVTGNLMAAVAGLILGIVARKRSDYHRNFNLWGIILSSVAIGISLLVLAFVFLMIVVIISLIPVGIGLAGV